MMRNAVLALLCAVPMALSAQDSAATHAPAPAVTAPAEAAPAPTTVQEQAGPASKSGPDFIMPHITDSHEIEFPGGYAWHLPRWEPIHIGEYAIDISPTKHVMFMGLAALLAMIVLVGAARSSTAGHKM